MKRCSKLATAIGTESEALFIYAGFFSVRNGRIPDWFFPCVYEREVGGSIFTPSSDGGEAELRKHPEPCFCKEIRFFAANQPCVCTTA
jgi:hypothetical protein